MMSLREFVRREGVIDPATLTLDAWAELDAALEETDSVDALLDDMPQALASLTQKVLHTVIMMLRRRNAWWQAREAFIASRAERGEPELPLSAVDETASPRDLAVLTRASRLLPSDAFEDEAAWAAALEASVELARRALTLTLSEGAIYTTLDADNERADDFAELANSRQTLADLPPKLWQKIRRGERAGALSVVFELPLESIQAELEVHREALAPALGGQDGERGDDAFLAELSLDSVEDDARAVLDRRADRAAIEAAGKLYIDLLSTPPMNAPRLAGIYVGGPRKPIGLAVVDRSGEVRSTARIAPTPGWAKRVRAWIRSEEIKHVALPTLSAASDALTELRRALSGGLTLMAVHPAALEEAREPLLSGRRLITPEAASAAVLARRALNPAGAWLEVDPIQLGLADYQTDLDAEELKAEFDLAQRLAHHRPHRGGPRRPLRRPATPVVNTKDLNPQVKSIQDLRPGMTVSAVVTNIARFGAFVDIGLQQQALIHISDLADRFVEDPAEIVSPGQQLEARVTNIDLARSRISLSLRAEGSPRPSRGDGPSDGAPRRGVVDRGAERSRPWSPGSNSRGGGSSPADRSKALRDLDKLFNR